MNQFRTNKQNNVLRLLLRCQGPHNPLGMRRLTSIILQFDIVRAGLVDGEASVRLGRDIDDGRLAGVLGKEILEPLEVPLLELGLPDAEKLGNALLPAPLLRDGDGELLVRPAMVERLGPVDGRVHLDAEIEVLSGQEIGLVGREQAAESRTAA